jgi:AraC-like DNA-binding protein
MACCGLMRKRSTPSWSSFSRNVSGGSRSCQELLLRARNGPGLAHERTGSGSGLVRSVGTGHLAELHTCRAPVFTSTLSAGWIVRAAIMNANDGTSRQSESSMRDVSSGVLADFTPRAADRHGRVKRSCPRSGLAASQARRLCAYIEDKLDSTIRAIELARLVGLSTSHFCRAFRKTFGVPPIAYVLKRRMVRAQKLMLRSETPLSQVALECGMCDQAHFSRSFRRIVGTNPAAWRRQSLLGLLQFNAFGS